MQAQAREGNPAAWGFTFSFTGASLASAGAVRCAAAPPALQTTPCIFVPAALLCNGHLATAACRHTRMHAHSSRLWLTCLALAFAPPSSPLPLPACSWERHTLDGSPTLLPPLDSPQDLQAWHFLDFYSTEDLQQDSGTVSRTRCTNLLPGVVSFNLVAKGFFYGG